MAEPTQDRLDELAEQIDGARGDAEDDGLLADSNPEPTFLDPEGDEQPNAFRVQPPQ